MVTEIRHRERVFCSLYWRKRYETVLLGLTRISAWIGVWRRHWSGGVAALQAALDLGLQIVAKIVREDPRGDEFAKIGNGEFRQEGQDGGQCGRWLANESKADVIAVAPLWILGDGLDDDGRELVPCQSAEDLRFVEARVGKRGFDDSGLTVTTGSARVSPMRMSMNGMASGSPGGTAGST